MDIWKQLGSGKEFLSLLTGIFQTGKVMIQITRNCPSNAFHAILGKFDGTDEHLKFC